jgi:hypothetical protein
VVVDLKSSKQSQQVPGACVEVVLLEFDRAVHADAAGVQQVTMRDGSRITEERPRAWRDDARTTWDDGAGAASAGARVSRNARTVGVRK